MTSATQPDAAETVLRVFSIFFKVILALLLIAFLIPATISGIFAYRTHAFLQKAVQVECVVKALEPGNDGTLYTLYEYEDAEHVKHQGRTTWASNPPAHQVGDKAAVYYDPAAPREGKMEGLFEMWGFALIAGIFAAVILIIGLALLVVEGVILWALRRARRKAQEATAHA